MTGEIDASEVRGAATELSKVASQPASAPATAMVAMPPAQVSVFRHQGTALLAASLPGDSFGALAAILAADSADTIAAFPSAETAEHALASALSAAASP